MNEITQHYLRLPLSVKGAVLPTPEGDYQIIINSAYNLETQREIFNHEMRHILLGHLHSATSLRIAEQDASNGTLLRRQIRSASQKGLPLRHVLACTQPPHGAAALHQPPPLTHPTPAIRTLPPLGHRLPNTIRLARGHLTNTYY